MLLQREAYRIRFLDTDSKETEGGNDTAPPFGVYICCAGLYNPRLAHLYCFSCDCAIIQVETSRYCKILKKNKNKKNKVE